MKTAELTGPRLDYWVAKAEGIECALECFMTRTPKPIACWKLKDGKPDFDAGPFCPSSAWHEGGPIIERENIQVSNHAASPPGMTLSLWYAVLPVCQPKRCATRRGHGYMDGDTPLIAAMRCYVASVYGEEVPDHA